MVDLSGSWLCGGFVLVTASFTKGSNTRLWLEKRRWSSRGLLFSYFAVFCVCGWEWKAASSTHQLSYESGSKLTALMAQSNNQSLDIRFKSLSALWKMRCKPLLYLWHNDYAIGVCDIERAEEYVVIQYCTSALPAVHRDHCLTALWLSRKWRIGRHYTNKGVFTKCRIISEVLSSFLSVFCACCCFVSCAQRRFGKSEAYSALCTSSIDESNSHRNPHPQFITLTFYLPPSLFHYYFYLSLQHIFLPSTTTPPATSNNGLSLSKHRSSFLRQCCLPLSVLVWNWIADPLALSGSDVIWDSGNRMLWCWRQLLQDTKGSQMTLDS